MPIYEGKGKGRRSGTFRVVVYVRGKAIERSAPSLELAKQLEDELRRQHSGRRPKAVRVIKSPDGTYALRVGKDRAAPLVYFIRAGHDGPIKIGFTSDLKARINALRCGSTTPLYLLGVLPGGRLLESALHAAFREARFQDKEWFRPTEALLALVDELFPAEERRRVSA